MCRTIFFANRKGGSGKTTVTVNLAGALGKMGKKVLVVDTDPQCHATLISGINPYKEGRGLGSALKNFDFKRAILKTPHDIFDILPSFHEEGNVILYAGKPANWITFQNLKTAYDFILIDTPPARDDILHFASAVADEFMVPLPLQFLAMEGLSQLIGLLRRLSRTINPELKLSAIIPVMIYMRTVHANEVLKELLRVFGADMVKRGVRMDVKVSDAGWRQMPINVFQPNSKAAMDFHLLAEDIVNGGKIKELL